MANLASLTKATIFSNLNADSSWLRKSNTVWSVRSLAFTQPDTRTLPSKFDFAAIGSGAFRYDWIFWDGSASGSFHLEGGPRAPHDEIKSLVDDEVDAVLGVTMKADVIVEPTARSDEIARE